MRLSAPRHFFEFCKSLYGRVARALRKMTFESLVLTVLTNSSSASTFANAFVLDVAIRSKRSPGVKLTHRSA